MHRAQPNSCFGAFPDSDITEARSVFPGGRASIFSLRQHMYSNRIGPDLGSAPVWEVTHTKCRTRTPPLLLSCYLSRKQSVEKVENCTGWEGFDSARNESLGQNETCDL